MEAAYVTRTMNRDEVALAIEWAAEEGWNPGLHDAETFRAADPQGFFVGTLNGEAVAAISVVKYEPGFAFLGLYIVRPEWRGRGLGWALWQHGMTSAAGRRVGLDGVVAQQANYRKSGFELAWRNVRYEGCGGTPAPNDARIVDLAGVPLSTVCAFDKAYFPGERRGIRLPRSAGGQCGRGGAGTESRHAHRVRDLAHVYGVAAGPEHGGPLRDHEF
jgi:ribosomal protein S18 acetylase RimI-like enzyme